MHPWMHAERQGLRCRAVAVGAYPGSFNPLTVAHLAIAEAAVAPCGLHRVELVVSRSPIDKEHVDRPLLEHRVEVLEAAAASRPWLSVRVTTHRLLADIAEGYDALVMGADKWAQVLDPVYYDGSPAARDAAVARLPRVVVAPRPPFEPTGVEVLDLDGVAHISSTAVRDGAHTWMAPEAAAFDERTGAWSDPDRYDRWLAEAGATPR